MMERKEAFQEYLDELLQKQFFHTHPEFLKFFEISRFSFLPQLGLKRKEGLVKKKSGGHQVGVGWYRGLKSLCPCLKTGTVELRSNGPKSNGNLTPTVFEFDPKTLCLSFCI